MIVFVSDLFAEDYPGGAELTTEALINKCHVPFVKIRSQEISLHTIDKLKDKFWIFGNFSNLSPEILVYISKVLNYSVLEYDYKYCSFRSPEKHQKHEGSCNCRLSKLGKSVSIFLASASTLWFMSEGQKKFYCDLYPFLDKDNVRVLSSVFDDNSLDYFSKKEKTSKNNKWLIQGSDSWIKGTDDAIKYAKENNLEYEVFKNLSYRSMLDKFSQSKGFITLPRGKDTCPRTAIEAKLLGCQIICNENVQHKDESWFSGDKKDTLEYLKNRTKVFWENTILHSGLNLPSLNDADYKNKVHFKIIIPVYNSEKWIGRCISSVLEQEYDNFQCIVCDDISSDNTYQTAKSISMTDNRIIVAQNKDKKYALKNIYDSILSLNPKKDDVIVILDGDDWFSSSHVLNNLAKHYVEEGCHMTYGSFIEYPSGRIGSEASSYPSNTIESNSYRKDKWRASHLKTFKYFLWQKVEKEDLLDDDGEFYEMTYDQAMMLPMLEMSGNKARYISQVNYVYNTSNPNAINKTRAQKQHNLMLKIRSKNPYNRLEDEDIS